GSYLNIGDRKLTAAPITGVISSVSPMQQTVSIQLDGDASIEAEHLANRVVYFANENSRRAHPIAAAKLKGNHLSVTTQDALLVGRVKITDVASNKFITDTALPLSPTYKGTTLLNDAFEKVAALKNVEGGVLNVAGKIERS